MTTSPPPQSEPAQDETSQAATSESAPAEQPRPAVIAHDVHVTYRTYGGSRNALNAGAEPGSGLRGMLRKATAGVGAVTEVHAVRGVSFVVNHGESVGIIGRNGSGKSTFLSALAGLTPISSGAIWAEGQVSHLGVNAALMKSLSGERNIMLGGLAQGLTRRQVRERFDDIVEFSGIGDFVKLPMRAYSSGMAARLRFAISSATIPDILIIDEALATGDAEFRQRSEARVEEIREGAGTVFLVSHSAGAIRRMCSRVIWMEKGLVLEDGEPDEVLKKYEAFIEELRTKPKRG